VELLDCGQNNQFILTEQDILYGKCKPIL